MNKTYVYDLPLRVFHLLFAILFICSFTIGKFVDDESTLYSFHMLSGILMSVLVILRIYWGLYGNHFARFSSFNLRPRSLQNYFLSLNRTQTKSFLEHNPASSWSTVIMLSLSLLMLLSGLLMINGVEKEFFEEVHEVFALIFASVVLLHIAGVLRHQIFHKDDLPLSIFTGYKKSLEGHTQTVHRQSSIFAKVLFFSSLIVFTVFLVRSYNIETQMLKIGKHTLYLGHESEGITDEH